VTSCSSHGPFLGRVAAAGNLRKNAGMKEVPQFSSWSFCNRSNTGSSHTSLYVEGRGHM
jgi:hypothetical protein